MVIHDNFLLNFFFFFHYLITSAFFRFGECSQICNVKKDGNHTCSCAPGYSLHSWSQKSQKSCFADGNLAYMIIANDNHLRKLSPYKHGNSASILALTEVRLIPARLKISVLLFLVCLSACLFICLIVHLCVQSFNLDIIF